MRKRVVFALLSLIAAAALVEALARLAIYAARGRSTVGLHERSRQLEYEAFTMFGPGWEARLGAHRRPTPGVSVPFRVLLLGGSTAAAFPPAVLASEIAAVRGEPVEVIVAAHGGYNARQELLLAALWARRLECQVLVTLDGANDLLHRLHARRGEAFYLDDAYRMALTRPLLSPFVYALRRSQALHGLRRLVQRRRLGSADDYVDAVATYVDAQRSLNAVARGVAAQRVMVLQPFLALKRPLSPEEAAFDTYRYREAVMIALYDRAHAGLQALAEEDGVAYVDARRAFDGATSTVFTDEVHFVNDDAYRRLARYVVEQTGTEVWRAR